MNANRCFVDEPEHHVDQSQVRMPVRDCRRVHHTPGASQPPVEDRGGPLGASDWTVENDWCRLVARCSSTYIIPPHGWAYSNNQEASSIEATMMNTAMSHVMDWVQNNNGEIDKNIQVTYLNDQEGHSMRTTSDLPAGQVTMTIPFDLCLSRVSATSTPELSQILIDHADVLTDQDEILALHLMVEKFKGPASRWAPYLETLPATVDLPMLWSEHELAELQGTNVYLLTKMMQKQVLHDFESIHLPLLRVLFTPDRACPELCDYQWALSMIWSRAFGVTRPESGEYLHVLCPVMDMLNHDVSIEHHVTIDDYIRYDGDRDVLTHCVPTSIPRDSPVHIKYGTYSNSKLLYSYGFISCPNTTKCVDFWLTVPSQDPFASYKQELVQEYDCQPQFDFTGSIFGYGIVAKLLTSLRIFVANGEELALVQEGKVVPTEQITTRNERAAFSTLLKSLQLKIKSYATSVEQDLALLENKDELSCRQRMAIQVRIEEKEVVAETIMTLERTLEKMPQNSE